MTELEKKRGLKRLKGAQPFRRFIPSLMTLTGLCLGLSSIRFAMLERWELCITLIAAAALIDALDGGAARLLRATSNFGAQLDSLSDFICFGVAPVIILYMWVLEDIKRYGWAVVLFFAVCSALRLARFNTAMVEETPKNWEKRFFVGVPSPAGGLLVLMPLLLAIEFNIETYAWLVALYVLVVGSFMVSRIPTFALKNLRIPAVQIIPFMLLAVLLLVFAVTEPWKALFVVGVGYIVSIPVSYWYHKKLSNQE